MDIVIKDSIQAQRIGKEMIKQLPLKIPRNSKESVIQGREDFAPYLEFQSSIGGKYWDLIPVAFCWEL